jgi:hypothetical protein
MLEKLLGKSITVVEDFWGNEFYNFVEGKKFRCGFCSEHLVERF